MTARAGRWPTTRRKGATRRAIIAAGPRAEVAPEAVAPTVPAALAAAAQCPVATGRRTTSAGRAAAGLVVASARAGSVPAVRGPAGSVAGAWGRAVSAPVARVAVDPVVADSVRVGWAADPIPPPAIGVRGQAARPADLVLVTSVQAVEAQEAGGPAAALVMLAPAAAVPAISVPVPAAQAAGFWR